MDYNKQIFNYSPYMRQYLLSTAYARIPGRMQFPCAIGEADLQPEGACSSVLPAAPTHQPPPSRTPGVP